jgi:hypothetical protein
VPISQIQMLRSDVKNRIGNPPRSSEPPIILRANEENHRSWVQLPPGPFLPAREIRYYIEFVLDNCRTNLAAIPLESQIRRSFLMRCLTSLGFLDLCLLAYAVQSVMLFQH